MTWKKKIGKYKILEKTEKYETPRIRVLSINGDPLTQAQKVTIILGNVYYLLEDAKYYGINTYITKKIRSLIEDLEDLRCQYENEYERPPYLEDI